MLEKLRNLTVDRIDLDEAVALATLARATSHGYTHYDVPAPAWLTNAIDQLDGEINRRRKDILQARSREVAAELTQLQTREERRAKLMAEQSRLNDAIGAAK